MNFDQAFARLLGHEGGYVDHPADPGGATRYGVTNRSRPSERLHGAHARFPARVREADLPGQLLGCREGRRLPAGPALRPIRRRGEFRAGAGCEMDATRRRGGRRRQYRAEDTPALKMADGPVSAARFNGHRLAFMASLPTWRNFGKGWARGGIAENLIAA